LLRHFWQGETILNPARRSSVPEFVDCAGGDLRGYTRRFHHALGVVLPPTGLALAWKDRISGSLAFAHCGEECDRFCIEEHGARLTDDKFTRSAGP
jgi:hypothetical protein